MRKVAWSVITVMSVLAAAVPALATGPVADVHLGLTQVEWTPTAELAGVRLTVSGPLGTRQIDFGTGEAPHLDLSIFGQVADGLYTWELRATPPIDRETRSILARSRAAGSEGIVDQQRPAGLPSLDALVQNGSFLVADGVIVQPSNEIQAEDLHLDVTGQGLVAAQAPLQRASAELNVSDDLFVHNSACVGFDCVFAGESFGADTIRVKENTTRIHFDDTSSLGGFPSNDWRLAANDQNSGGRNIFILQDATANRDVFAVEAGARSNALYVESDGDVGLGTANPVVDLHVVTGNTPTLRLDQDGSSGFAAQAWDVAGNETNFFVRDVTGGSRLPLRIRPGAPTSSIDVAADGDVGIGTASPSSALHVRRTNGTAKLTVEEASGTEAERTVLAIVNNGNSAFDFQDTSADGSTWQFKVSGPSIRFNKSGTGGDEIVIRDRLDGTGQATLVVNGSVQATNVTFASSRTLKTAFEPVDGRDVLAKIDRLPISRWQYTDLGDRRHHIGPMAEDFEEVFRLGSDGKTISVTDVNGVSLAAIQSLYRLVQEKEMQINHLEERLAALESSLAQRASRED